MNIPDGILKKEELILLALRALYRRYGYTQYKMRKFEEYDLYADNRDFLVSGSVITFHDTDGKLLALKPDVTLSIVRSGRDEPGTVQKVYYQENVYRVAGYSRSFREIMQAGVECIGEVDACHLAEMPRACVSYLIKAYWPSPTWAPLRALWIRPGLIRKTSVWRCPS